MVTVPSPILSVCERRILILLRSVGGEIGRIFGRVGEWNGKSRSEDAQELAPELNRAQNERSAEMLSRVLPIDHP